jgi:hypothetical protein
LREFRRNSITNIGGEGPPDGDDPLHVCNL